MPKKLSECLSQSEMLFDVSLNILSEPVQRKHQHCTYRSGDCW